MIVKETMAWLLTVLGMLCLYVAWLAHEEAKDPSPALIIATLSIVMGKLTLVRLDLADAARLAKHREEMAAMQRANLKMSIELSRAEFELFVTTQVTGGMTELRRRAGILPSDDKPKENA